MNDKIELTEGMSKLFGIEKDRIVRIVQELEELAFQYNRLEIFDFAKKIKEHYFSFEIDIDYNPNDEIDKAEAFFRSI